MDIVAHCFDSEPDLEAEECDDWIRLTENTVGVFKHRYALTDHKRIPWDDIVEMLHDKCDQYEQDPDEVPLVTLYLLLRNLVLSIPDGNVILSPHTDDTEAVAQEVMRTKIGGSLGFMCNKTGDNRRVIVTSVYPGTLAADKGLQPGSEVLSFQSDTVWDAVKNEEGYLYSTYVLQMPATDAHRDMLKLAYLTRGPVGMPCRVKVRNPAGYESFLELEYQNDNYFHLLETHQRLQPPADVLDSDGIQHKTLESNIGYIRLVQNHEDTPNLFQKALTSLVYDEQVETLILDVRGNVPEPGITPLRRVTKMLAHFMDNDLFIGQLPVLDVDGEETGEFEPLCVEPQLSHGMIFDRTVVCLVNIKTIGWAEVFVSAMKQLPNVTVFGTHSTTNGSVCAGAEILDLPCGFRLHMTTLTMTDRNGDVILDSDGHFGGVAVDQELPRTVNDLLHQSKGIDAGLEGAVHWIKGPQRNAAKNIAYNKPTPPLNKMYQPREPSGGGAPPQYTTVPYSKNRSDQSTTSDDSSTSRTSSTSDEITSSDTPSPSLAPNPSPPPKDTNTVTTKQPAAYHSIDFSSGDELRHSKKAIRAYQPPSQPSSYSPTPSPPPQLQPHPIHSIHSTTPYTEESLNLSGLEADTRPFVPEVLRRIEEQQENMPTTRIEQSIGHYEDVLLDPLNSQQEAPPSPSPPPPVQSKIQSPLSRKMQNINRQIVNQQDTSDTSPMATPMYKPPSVASRSSSLPKKFRVKRVAGQARPRRTTPPSTRYPAKKGFRRGVSPASGTSRAGAVSPSLTVSSTAPIPLNQMLDAHKALHQTASSPLYTISNFGQDTSPTYSYQTSVQTMEVPGLSFQRCRLRVTSQREIVEDGPCIQIGQLLLYDDRGKLIPTRDGVACCTSDGWSPDGCDAQAALDSTKHTKFCRNEYTIPVDLEIQFPHRRNIGSYGWITSNSGVNRDPAGWQFQLFMNGEWITVDTVEHFTPPMDRCVVVGPFSVSLDAASIPTSFSGSATGVERALNANRPSSSQQSSSVTPTSIPPTLSETIPVPDFTVAGTTRMTSPAFSPSYATSSATQAYSVRTASTLAPRFQAPTSSSIQKTRTYNPEPVKLPPKKIKQGPKKADGAKNIYIKGYGTSVVKGVPSLQETYNRVKSKYVQEVRHLDEVYEAPFTPQRPIHTERSETPPRAVYDVEDSEISVISPRSKQSVDSISHELPLSAKRQPPFTPDLPMGRSTASSSPLRERARSSSPRSTTSGASATANYVSHGTAETTATTWKTPNLLGKKRSVISTPLPNRKTQTPVTPQPRSYSTMDKGRTYRSSSVGAFSSTRSRSGSFYPESVLSDRPRSGVYTNKQLSAYTTPQYDLDYAELRGQTSHKYYLVDENNAYVPVAPSGGVNKTYRVLY